MTNETWDRTFDINVKGPMMQMCEAINYFSEKGGGAILVTASAAGLGAVIPVQIIWHQSVPLLGLHKMSLLPTPIKIFVQM